jgi:hypothetical protein
VAEITENKTRTFKGIGHLYDMDGKLLAECDAVYFKIETPFEHLDEQKTMVADNITEIDY